MNHHIETRIARKLVDEFLSLGYALGVNDGEGTIVGPSHDPDVIMAALRSGEADYLLVHESIPAGLRRAYRLTGWVALVWGRGSFVIGDYTQEIERVVDPVMNWACNREMDSIFEAAHACA